MRPLHRGSLMPACWPQPKAHVTITRLPKLTLIKISFRVVVFSHSPKMTFFRVTTRCCPPSRQTIGCKAPPVFTTGQSIHLRGTHRVPNAAPTQITTIRTMPNKRESLRHRRESGTTLWLTRGTPPSIRKCSLTSVLSKRRLAMVRASRGGIIVCRWLRYLIPGRHSNSCSVLRPVVSCRLRLM